MEGGICRECVCSQWWICSLSWELAVLAPSSAREIVELAVKSLRPLWWHWRETNVHNKRPKIHSFSLDWNCHFAAATSSDTDNYSLNGRDSINQGIPVLNNDGDENSLVSSGRKDNAFRCDTITMEDLVVQMDLPNDLLHTVFLFLGPLQPLSCC
ncbi:uncharacterized protein LOC132308090 isoform X1 [Cornus florida]|uniref:uncharacterized protein LOC132308090 isoform X1 n=1 Tax=Cornus florida TaxID=4283 RepID=UPI00289BAAD4|nr:uncharacterized protein LOC132308090 isoform X1 [Cornus florida]